MDRKGKILAIDDNEDVLFALNILLSAYAEKVRVTTKPEQAERFIHEFNPDIILLDMNFAQDAESGNEGFYWLEKILQIDHSAVVILMTAYADTEKAVRAIKSGATDFIPKPWEKDKLLATIHAALKLRESQKEIHFLKSRIQTLNREMAPQMIGRSEPMIRLFDMINKVSATDANILILGENGTGKDLVARTIHFNSCRAERVFASIDLGSISESLFESELFGYEKGAFTDAKKEKQGRIETASGGTLFLDEICNLSLPMQAKLLTALEKKNISRLGATKSIPVDIRLISATNADIYTEMEEGNFRQDLLYRINTIELHIPPLSDRGDDIILLAEFFLNKFQTKYKKDIAGITRDAKQKLSSYHWPGNVRELQNSIERAVILSTEKMLTAEDFVLAERNNRKLKENSILNLDTLEQIAIQKAMNKSDGNLTKAAELLGISRFALYRKLNK